MAHDKNNICPGCNQDSSNLTLSDLVKTYEPCNCNAEEFVHLVETTWHRRCFLRQGRERAAEPEAAEGGSRTEKQA